MWSSNSNSWVGLGLSPMGGMYGADIWILLKNSAGAYYIQGFIELLLNLQSTKTAFTFMRAIKTCDSSDLEIIQGTRHHLIWAFGQGNSAPRYHGTSNRGNAIVTLYPNAINSLASKAKAKAKASVASLKASSDLKSVSILFPNVTIPAEQTTYLCTHFEAPADRKYHVVQYEALVHHLVLYGCVGKPNKIGDVYPCLANMEALCSRFTLAWAPGVGTTLFPEEAGFAIGVGTNAIQYFSLQIHYNNPTGAVGIVDGSGMKLYYTSVLRKFDIGVLTLGNYDINITGNKNSYTMTNWNICPSTCTKQFPQNLTVVSTAFHMHTLGYNITTRHIRGDKELIPLGIRKYYDFSLLFRRLTPTLLLCPGDNLLTQCTYIPTAGVRKNVTTFGESTNDEMCFNFLTYYPAMPRIDTCLGDPYDPYAFCATSDIVVNATVTQLFSNGWIVPAAMPSFTPFSEPVCKATFSKSNDNNLLKTGDASRRTGPFGAFVLVAFILLSL
ncbi:PHM/PNGase F domain-containing protein [Obelidium mucronatum]|nr:PHM/PNGase F domain-containing protein [Obelidium mucronatum]